jgi:chromosome segregation ATPase
MKHLLQYIDFKGLTIHNFEKKIGIRGSLDKAIKQNTNVRGDIFTKIIEEFEDINPEWLITGKGEMLRGVEEKKENCNEKLKPLQEQLQFKEEQLSFYKEKIEMLTEKLENCETEKKVFENSKPNV